MAGKKKQYEDAEQEALFQWARLEPMPNDPGVVGEYLFAIPNGGRRNVREAARFRRQGVKAGVSDLFLPVPIYGAVAPMSMGLWIEMKKRREHFRSMGEADKAMSETQAHWFHLMRDQGYACKCCYGWEDASACILAYLNM